MEKSDETKIGCIHDYNKVDENGRRTMVICQHVGDGTFGKGESKKEFELAVAMSQSPMVRYGSKTYLLTWTEILRLAEAAGLFDD